MTQYDLQADVNALKTFAQGVGGTSGTAGSGGGLAGEVQGLPGSYKNIDTVNFGQFASDGTTYTGFTDAFDMYHAYLDGHQGLIASPESSLNTFVSQLNALASAAATVAQRYQDAQTEDTVGATDVDNALNTIPSPSRPA